jgi:hypothetical protein
MPAIYLSTLLGGRCTCFDAYERTSRKAFLALFYTALFFDFLGFSAA